MTRATTSRLSHSATLSIELGATGWILPSVFLLTRQVPLFLGHSGTNFGAGGWICTNYLVLTKHAHICMCFASLELTA